MEVKIGKLIIHHNITWTSTGVTNVKLDYTTNNGTSWTEIIESTPASTGSYSWTIPNTPSIQCKIRVSDTANISINDESDTVFTISSIPTITVTSPNGGENWQVSSTNNITWTSTNIANVKLEYTTNSGTSWTDIIESTPASTGSYSWTIPNTPSIQCKIRVSDAANISINDESDTVFTISSIPTITVTSPNGGENWQVDSSQNITWTSTNVSNVKLEYTTNNGASWTNIIASTPASTGSYSWTIPNTPSIQCKIRVSDAANISINDESDTVFTISSIPTITVTSPNGGENWRVGTYQNIIWTSINVSNVKLEYTTNKGANWTNIIASTPASTGSYSWTIPNTPSIQCKIRVSDAANTSINDESDTVFTISSIPTITVTSPNGGENWQVSSQIISLGRVLA